MGECERADYVRKLRAALERGESLRAFAGGSGKSLSTARRIAAQEALPVRKPARRLAPGARRRILRALAGRDTEGTKRSLRRIAQLTGAGKSTVQRLANPTIAGAPRRVRPYTCPGCEQRVNLAPCVICAALGVARGTGRGRA